MVVTVARRTNILNLVVVTILLLKVLYVCRIGLLVVVFASGHLYFVFLHYHCFVTIPLNGPVTFI